MTWQVFEVAIFLVACAFAIKYIKKSHYLDDDKPLDVRVENDPRLAAVVLTLDEKRLLPDRKLAAIKSVKNRTGFELKDAYAVVAYYLKHNGESPPSTLASGDNRRDHEDSSNQS